MEAIANNEGKRVPDYVNLTGISGSTIDKYITKFRKAQIIAFSGKATKIGGYYISEELRNVL